MIRRIERIQVELPPPSDPDPAGAAAVQELLGGKFGEMSTFPPSLLPRLDDLREKVLLGSDFPTIPYPYLHQLESLARLDMGEEWLRAVCWNNGVRLFGMNGRGTPR